MKIKLKSRSSYQDSVELVKTPLSKIVFVMFSLSGYAEMFLRLVPHLTLYYPGLIIKTCCS